MVAAVGLSLSENRFFLTTELCIVINSSLWIVIYLQTITLYSLNLYSSIQTKITSNNKEFKHKIRLKKATTKHISFGIMVWMVWHFVRCYENINLDCAFCRTN